MAALLDQLRKAGFNAAVDIDRKLLPPVRN
jgi:hypothetical protein